MPIDISSFLSGLILLAISGLGYTIGRLFHVLTSIRNDIYSVQRDLSISLAWEKFHEQHDQERFTGLGKKIDHLSR